MSGSFFSKPRETFALRLIAVLVALCGGCAAAWATPTGPAITVGGLQTDALIAPLGISDLTPKLSWIDTANVNGAVQAAYQIQAAASASNLAAGKLLWDSGQAQSPAQNAQYNGTPLASRSSVTWQVRVWDGTGSASAWSAPATFQVGLHEAERLDCSVDHQFELGQ